MYIFLDESYNLKDRDLPQFISISGFKVLDVKPVWKRWKAYRLPFVSVARIHAVDLRFELLRRKCFHLIAHMPDATLLTVMQEIAAIPTERVRGYYHKDKLNFDKVYEDMLKALFMEVRLSAYKKVVVTIESREMTGGRLGKDQMIKSLRAFAAAYTPATFFEIKPQPFSTNTMLEMADFISNSFYKHYTGGLVEGLEPLLTTKTIAIKNPLR